MKIGYHVGGPRPGNVAIDLVPAESAGSV